MRFASLSRRFSALLFLAVTAVLILFAMPAMAQDVPPVVAPVVVADQPSAFLQTMLVPLIGALGTALAALFAFLAALLRNKSMEASASAGAKLAATLGDKAMIVMQAVVTKMQVEFREPLEAVAKDGVLSKDEKTKLREKAVELFLSSLGDALKGQLMGALGVNESGLKNYAGGLVEQTLSALKVEQSRSAAVRAQAESIVAQANQKAAEAKPAAASNLPEDIVARLAGEQPKP